MKKFQYVCTYTNCCGLPLNFSVVVAVPDEILEEEGNNIMCILMRFCSRFDGCPDCIHIKEVSESNIGYNYILGLIGSRRYSFLTQEGV